MEDPIFEPWSEIDESTPSRAAGSPRWRSPSGPVPSVSPGQPLMGGRGPRQRPEGTAGLLRQLAVPRLEAIARRLKVARHEASLEDDLDETPSLLRFELEPCPGPLDRSPAAGPAMLEIGLAPESNEIVTAWYWLDRLGEAPVASTSILSGKLDAAWIESVVLDFVGRVLARAKS